MSPNRRSRWPSVVAYTAVILVPSPLPQLDQPLPLREGAGGGVVSARTLSGQPTPPPLPPIASPIGLRDGPLPLPRGGEGEVAAYSFSLPSFFASSANSSSTVASASS